MLHRSRRDLRRGSDLEARDGNAVGGEMAGEQRRLLVCLADLINRRLIEGIAAQLQLTPVQVEEDELQARAEDRDLEMLLADEAVARRWLAGNGAAGQSRDGLRFALVAVVPASMPDGAVHPKPGAPEPFDGVLALPQPPAVVTAQLSVILYAHRTYAKRYESALEELNLNRRIFRSVTSGISVADALRDDFPLVYVNPAFEVMTGYSLEEIEGKNCRFLQRDDRSQPGLTLIREALKAQRETVALIRNYRRDGTPFWNELSLSPIRDRSGLVTHFVGIQNDVTGRIAFEEALRESEKLAAVGRLAASIAHEINNPLESVTNLIYLAQREDEPARRAEYLGSAEEELKRVSQLTAQSLRFYKQSSRPQAIRPADLITAVVDVYLPKIANYGIGLERCDWPSEPVVCLESEIRQVLSNLIRNAMDAMQGRGGRLTVKTRSATDWKTQRQGVAITIADTGTGMSPETLERLYTAFYTTKGISGTGLGMWVSSEIVARHHGRLSVRSRQGQRSGTVFTLFLPYEAMAA